MFNCKIHHKWLCSTISFVQLPDGYYFISHTRTVHVPQLPAPPLPLPCEEPEQVPARRSLFDEPPEVEAREVEEEKVIGDAVDPEC